MMILTIITASFATALLAIVLLAIFPRLNIWQLVIAYAAVVIVAGLVLLLLFLPVGRQDARTITRDNGGSIPAYMARIRTDAIAGRQVRIIGQCHSACTMYLSLPTACVSRSAVLGFHGPSSQLYEISLPPREFEYWSHIMADHYPPALQPWFLHTARFETLGLIRVAGADLIDTFGIKECAE